MFNKKIFIYLSKTHLFVYYKDLNQPLRIELEPTTIQDLERINIEWIRNKLDILLEKINLRNGIGVLVLGKDLVFDKIINEESLEEKYRETNDFIEHIPLPSNVVIYKEFIKDDNTLVTATCKNVYESVIDLFKEHEISIVSVLPEIVFNKIDFNKSFLSDLFKQKDLLEFGNFLDHKEDKNNSDTKFYIIVLLLILILGALLGLGAYFLNQNNGQVNLFQMPKTNILTTSRSAISNSDAPKINLNQQSQTTVQTTSPVQVSEPVNKDKIKVSIFNGTGIPGFASQIAKLVNDSGYKNTTTANAEKFDYTNTLIEVTSDIKDETIEEIRLVLKKSLKSFEIKKSLPGENIIKITTGEATKN